MWERDGLRSPSGEGWYETSFLDILLIASTDRYYLQHPIGDALDTLMPRPYN